MKQLEDYFDNVLADILEQDQERWDSKYMPSVDRVGKMKHNVSIDDFIGDYEEDY